MTFKCLTTFTLENENVYTVKVSILERYPHCASFPLGITDTILKCYCEIKRFLKFSDALVALKSCWHNSAFNFTRFEMVQRFQHPQDTAGLDLYVEFLSLIKGITVEHVFNE